MERTILVVVAVAVVAARTVLLSGMALAKARTTAKARIIDAQGEVIGKGTFAQVRGKVEVDVRVEGLERPASTASMPGALRSHRVRLRRGALQPQGAMHGLHNPEGPHAGDLPNLRVGEDGVLRATTDRVTLPGNRARSLVDADGTAVVIHEPQDGYMTDRQQRRTHRLRRDPETAVEDGSAYPGTPAGSPPDGVPEIPSRGDTRCRKGR